MITVRTVTVSLDQITNKEVMLDTQCQKLIQFLCLKSYNIQLAKLNVTKRASLHEYCSYLLRGFVCLREQKDSQQKNRSNITARAMSNSVCSSQRDSCIYYPPCESTMKLKEKGGCLRWAGGSTIDYGSSAPRNTLSPTVTRFHCTCNALRSKWEIPFFFDPLPINRLE